ncbi:copper homeostasis protein CutC [Streptosporangium sp. CA-115845]|uniref:copper homeostasis protein CutC n=1 Tax=Streptosporangium sp. CA-115845 TaxID=3240071 RepID=UPI003D9052E5
MVIGVLTPSGEVNAEVAKRLIGAAGGFSITFHRAFDMTADRPGWWSSQESAT